jgi:penicillin-binding protein 1A
MLVADVVKTSVSKRWKALRIFISVLTLITIGVMIALYMWLNTLGVFNLDLNRLDALRNFTYQDNSVVFDRNGAKIGEFFEKYHVFAAYDELPQHFIDALISIEDRNFYEHNGIDPMAILRAIYVRVRTGKAKQGASTLTQQLVRKTLLSNEKSLERKALEIAWALETERHITKEKILEIYVNSMFLGNGAYGVGAAARR